MNVYATLLGRICRPEAKTTQAGAKYVQFALACDVRKKRDGEWINHTNWYNVSAWSSFLANVAMMDKAKVMVRARQEYDKDKSGVLRLNLSAISIDIAEWPPKSSSEIEDSCEDSCEDEDSCILGSEIEDDDLPF